MYFYIIELLGYMYDVYCLYYRLQLFMIADRSTTSSTNTYYSSLVLILVIIIEVIISS